MYPLRHFTALLFVLLTIPFAAGGDLGRLFNEQGLRIKHYRAPTPATVPHAETIGAGQLATLISQSSPVLVDVLSVTVRPESAELEMAWLPVRERYSLPGAHWLPNVGYGVLSSQIEAYFRRNLDRLTQGDRQHALVFFCVRDCWMSWNAVQHAHGLGYRNLYWFPGGSDDWEAAGKALEELDPVPLEDAESGQE